MHLRSKLRKKYIKLYQYLRILHYSLMSDQRYSQPSCKILQPLLLQGKGKISINESVILGYFPSPEFYSGYHHIEARTSDSSIEIGKNTFINNSATIIADKAKIFIGKNVLVGPNFIALSSNFHPINSLNRLSRNYTGENILIDDNVFIGTNVTILKGVSIGTNSVIGANSLVNINIPPNSIAMGNPIQILRKINFE
jgi:acetyltransferase-like isoleucine patch superfamily enzyme